MLSKIVGEIRTHIDKEQRGKILNAEYALEGDFIVRRKDGLVCLEFEGGIIAYSPRRDFAMGRGDAIFYGPFGINLIESTRNLIRGLVKKKRTLVERLLGKTRCEIDFPPYTSRFSVSVSGSSRKIDPEIDGVRKLYGEPKVIEYSESAVGSSGI